MAPCIMAHYLYKSSEAYLNDKKKFEKYVDTIELAHNLDDIIINYLEKFSKNSLNCFYESIFYIIFWADVKYTKEIFVKLYTSICDWIEDNWSMLPYSSMSIVGSDYVLFEINLKVFELFDKISKPVSFRQLMKLFPSFERLVFLNSKLSCERFLHEILNYKNENNIGLIDPLFEMIVKLSQKNKISEVILLNAMIVVFIKGGPNSFFIIKKHLEFYKPETFEKFLSILDQSLTNKDIFQTILGEYGMISSPKMGQTRRFITRVCMAIDLPLFNSSILKNFHESSDYENILFLVRSYFNQNAISEDSFCELSRKLIEHSPSIEGRFLKHLLKYDVNYASKYQMKILKMNMISQIPLKSFKTTKNQLITNSDPSKNARKVYYRGNNNFEIVFISDELAFEDMLNNHLPKYKTLAIDAEWSPIFSYRKQKVAILQIATNDSCFLIDLFDLQNKSNTYKKQCTRLIENFFENSNYLKIGYAFGQDIENLCQTIGKEFRLTNSVDPSITSKNLVHFLSELNPNLYKIIDLEIQRSRTFIDETNEATQKRSKRNRNKINLKQIKGLSLLTYILCGKPLDKLECISDWERRPLRNEQLLYAAFDAHCLLQIYNKLEMIAGVAGYEDINVFLTRLSKLTY